MSIKDMIDDVSPQQGMVVWCDNQSALAIAKTVTGTKKSKYVRLKYLYCKENIRSGEQIVPKYVETRDQVADLATKELGKALTTKFRNLTLGLHGVLN